MIKAILACDDDWGIGKDGDLPWPHNPADIKWFKESTMGGVIVMGKTTWDSLPIQPLPGRKNIVVTSREAPKADIVVGIESVKDLLPTMENVWIVGGAKLIEGLLSIIDELHLSRIRGKYDCDTFLPVSLIEENYSLIKSGLQDDVYIDIWSKI